MVILLCGCSLDGSKTNPENSNADYVKYKDQMYINEPKMIVIDSTQLSKIDTVNESSTVPKDTPIYKINGYSDNDIIAVKNTNNALQGKMNIDIYNVYTLLKDMDVKTKKLDIFDQKIESVDLYKEGQFMRTLHGKESKKFIALVDAAKTTIHIDISNAVMYSFLYKLNSAIVLKYNVLEHNNQYMLDYTDAELPSAISHYFQQK